MITVKTLASQKSFTGEILQLQPWYWLGLVLVGFLIFLINYFGFITPLTSFIEYLALPARSDAYQSHQKLSSLLNSLQNVPNLLAEKEELSAEVITLKSKLAEVEEIFAENERLQKEAGIKYDRDYSQVGVQVVGYDNLKPGELFLNKGMDAGIEEGDSVVIEKILVGKVVQVGQYSSRVRTLLAGETALPVKTSKVQLGILASKNANQIIVEQILQNTELGLGEKVYTSGLNNEYPPDLLIGEIAKVEADARATTKVAILDPAIDYLKLSKLKVLTNVN